MLVEISKFKNLINQNFGYLAINLINIINGTKLINTNLSITLLILFY